MPTRLVSAVALLLLTVFFFNVCAFGVLLSAELHLHQQEQKDKIKNKKQKEIVELRISRELVEEKNSEFQWVKNWEFRWHGEMYDIEDSKVDGDEYVFEVKHDSEEDMLRKKIERHAQDETNKRNSQSKKNLKCGSEFFECTELVIDNNRQTVLLSSSSVLSLASAHRVIHELPPWLS